MQPAMWKTPVALTQQEEHIVNKIRKVKLFVFLRHHRHELFDEAFRGASWPVCIEKRRAASHQLPLPSWLWRSFWRHIPVFPMMR